MNLNVILKLKFEEPTDIGVLTCHFTPKIARKPKVLDTSCQTLGALKKELQLKLKLRLLFP